MKKTTSSFCMCFLPVVSDNGLMIGKRPKPTSLEVKPSLSPAKNTTHSGNCFGRKNKVGRRSLSRFVNAVLFETSLMKKIRNKKLGQKLHRIYNGERFKSKFKSESKPKKVSNPTTNDAPPGEGTSGNSSKITSCLSENSSSSLLMTMSGRSTLSSSRSSATTTSGRSSSALSETVGNNQMLEKGNGKSRHGSNIVPCCLLLVSLLVLVTWGKVCAIFCTSVMLVLLNRWIKLVNRGSSENVAVDRRVPEIDSKLYRKKIIMEGLLERNHTRNIY
ncbi:hypothetical protein HRI_004692800 [Hibiscus trionum]|uniref:Uncharacterized protein n=1 Tax=Hibiscus trionum TaxID=183268 RepID=A0A9W7J7R6_HIBTR|nr:hypothetical protein HRI_004692800 [Hibiscus trionum]